MQSPLRSKDLFDETLSHLRRIAGHSRIRFCYRCASPSGGVQCKLLGYAALHRIPERNRAILELQKSFSELERVLVRQRQAVWFQRKALSRALHGPVQMVVTAAAIRLDAAIRDGAVPPELIVSIRSELMSILDVLDELDEGSVSFSLALERMRAMWEGICVITEQSSAKAVAVLARGRVLQSMVIDITTEAVSNAVWHGNATVTSIRLDVVGQESDDLLIEVTTDGQGIDAPKRRGLGTQLLDDCSLRWSGEASEAGDCLTAVLPFASV